MRAPDRLTRTVLVVSLVLATSTPLVWDLTTPPANAGAVPTVQATPLPLSAADAADQTPTARMAGTEPKTDAIARRAGSPADNELRPATRSARIADLDLTPNPTPKTLRIPSIDVNAQIGAIGVEANGDMEVPDNARNLGWYRHGPAPDDPGATVIAGHVDSRTQGPGAFFDLRTLDVGARIHMTDTAGNDHHYNVVARRTYDKTVLPTNKLFSRTGPPQLILITCGGNFDNTTRSYRNNVVIYAQPSERR